jgi:hypothetical protein
MLSNVYARTAVAERHQTISALEPRPGIRQRFPAQPQNATLSRCNSYIRNSHSATSGDVRVELNMDHAHMICYASDSESIMKSSGVDDRTHDRQSQDETGGIFRPTTF